MSFEIKIYGLEANCFKQSSENKREEKRWFKKKRRSLKDNLEI